MQGVLATPAGSKSGALGSNVESVFVALAPVTYLRRHYNEHRLGTQEVPILRLGMLACTDLQAKEDHAVVDMAACATGCLDLAWSSLVLAGMAP